MSELTDLPDYREQQTELRLREAYADWCRSVLEQVRKEHETDPSDAEDGSLKAFKAGWIAAQHMRKP